MLNNNNLNGDDVDSKQDEDEDEDAAVEDGDYYQKWWQNIDTDVSVCQRSASDDDNDQDDDPNGNAGASGPSALGGSNNGKWKHHQTSPGISENPGSGNNGSIGEQQTYTRVNGNQNGTKRVMS